MSDVDRGYCEMIASVPERPSQSRIRSTVDEAFDPRRSSVRFGVLGVLSRDVVKRLAVTRV